VSEKNRRGRVERVRAGIEDDGLKTQANNFQIPCEALWRENQNRLAGR
jgi:hypothetical protein